MRGNNKEIICQYYYCNLITTDCQGYCNDKVTQRSIIPGSIRPEQIKGGLNEEARMDDNVWYYLWAGANGDIKVICTEELILKLQQSVVGGPQLSKEEKGELLTVAKVERLLERGVCEERLRCLKGT